MIKLSKGPEPDVLVRNSARWAQELLAAVASGDADRTKSITKRYNHPEVKSALKAETHEKCAYCEAKVTDVAHGDIEHVTPKSVARERTFDWNNLTFACQVCNQNKSKTEDILDPYNEDPEQNIFFVAAFAKGRTSRGQRTILELELNRVALLESRHREIERYANEVEKIFLVNDARIKELLFRSLLNELDTQRPEFVAACRSAIMQFNNT